MIRKGFRMSVEPDHRPEYIRRHNSIWRDLDEVLLVGTPLALVRFVERRSF